MLRRKPRVAEVARTLPVSPHNHKKNLLPWLYHGRCSMGNRLDQTFAKKTRSSYTCYSGNRLFSKISWGGSTLQNHREEHNRFRVKKPCLPEWNSIRLDSGQQQIIQQPQLQGVLSEPWHRAKVLLAYPTLVQWAGGSGLKPRPASIEEGIRLPVENISLL